MSENQTRDLVLNSNEYAFVLDKTKGQISCIVGPFKMSLSQQDALVNFNINTKRFEEVNFDEAIQTFIIAPENWYIELKNPSKEDKHPSLGTSNILTELLIGKKVNIHGPVNFALYPGQMAKIIRGHRLHSNQYLLARVYDADILKDQGYTVGQLLIIKGTDVPFYMPPTGIEVIPEDGTTDKYVRDAVTLERLEYCILKDEQGNKKYLHGPNVVFPEPDEIFIINEKDNSKKFRAIELSNISGIYLKVIEDYTDENNLFHKAGEELFITGKDQMIYYPRMEHSFISYDNKVIHHATAIPEGEGRYVLERETGKINMITGPCMYLPDPRKEVIVKRKLTKKQCELMYPDNNEVLEYNTGIKVEDINMFSRSSDAMNVGVKSKAILDTLSPACLYATSSNTTAINNGFYGQENATIESNGITRGNKYTKPRTITIDNKYDGVVTLNIWTGYAINVISKSGNRKVIIGPQTYLLGYDEDLEEMSLSTGKPKTTDNLYRTVYLRIENNKISDIVDVQTKDFVDLQIKVSYCVDFLREYKDKWFSVENYVKYLCDRVKSLLKKEVKKYNIEELYENVTDIVRSVVLDVNNKDSENVGRLFKENGMFIKDVEVLSTKIMNENVAQLIYTQQINTVQKSLTLTNAYKDLEISKELNSIEKEKAELNHKLELYKAELESLKKTDSINKAEELKRLQEKSELDAKNAQKELQSVLDDIQEAQLNRDRAVIEQKLELKEKQNNLEINRQSEYAAQLKNIIEAISPDLVAALTSTANADIIRDVAESMSPYSIANNESISDTVNKLLRGTSIENIFSKLINNINTSIENKENK